MRSLIAVILGLWVVACHASYDRADRAIQREFPRVRIGRIGDISLAYSDYADIVVLHALEAAVAAGVPEGAMREAIVVQVSQIGVARAAAPCYEVWVAIEGCASPVYMKANFAGRLFGIHDQSGCLGGAKKPASPGDRAPASRVGRARRRRAMRSRDFRAPVAQWAGKVHDGGWPCLF